MTEHFQQLLSWINAHPGWALVLLFLTAALDAVFIVGALVPAAPVLFAFGALVALGTLELWPAVAVAAAGALCGDGLGFWLGKKYGESLFETRFLKKYPEAVSNSHRFFADHGGKSLIIARFLGPLRAITPAVAGAAGIKTWIFITVDSVAAVLWALAYLMPGMVFGASLGLAAEVAGRLALVLVLLLVTIWLMVALTLFLGRQAQKHAEEWLGAMLDWSRRHRRLGVFGAALADRDQPETPVLAGVAFLLLALGVAALFGIWGWREGEPPGMDLATFQTLQSVREPVATWLAVHGSMLGEWPVYLPYFSCVLLMLLAYRLRRAAAHWLAALVFGGAITLGLGLVPHIGNPLEYKGWISTAHFPHDLVMSVVIYGFTPVLMGGGRRLYYTVAALALSVILLSRLYLGSLWLSVELIALLCGLLWVAALGLGYHRHLRGERPILRPFLPAMLVLAAAVAWHWSQAEKAPAMNAGAAVELKEMPAANWWNREWESLPTRRQDMAGKDRQYLNLQWSGSLDEISHLLLARGWKLPPPLSFTSSLRWLSPESEISELPLLPRYHAGRHQVLTLRKPKDAEHQYLLRLWPSEYQLKSDQPLWIGTLVVQERRRVARLFHYPINSNVYTLALDTLELPLPGYDARRALRHNATFTTLLLRPSEPGH